MKSHRPTGRRWLLLFLALSASAPVAADPSAVPAGYRTAAASARVGPALFYAIALAESGQQQKTAEFRPWPWTLSIDSRPRFYRTQAEALAALTAEIHRQQAGEPRQLGIGLFQIEWRFHAHRFDRVDQMLDPYENARVAADILAEHLAAADGDPWQAVGWFHSTTPELAAGYRQRVARRLVDLIGRE